ncbi:MAG TPA: M67 family metallopeptidase, partial [Bdellovibrionota bacterium]|nr:M67 family metallopeptidase [Bdellovibrionota bacterium]
HLEKCYPEEGCGFLIGRAVEGDRRVIRVQPSQNYGGESRGRRYSIDPKEFMMADQGARADHLDIVGIYHSHPDHPAAPSEFDRVNAWVGYSYVVVGVEKGKSKGFTSWTMNRENGEFLSEEIRRENEYVD